MKYTRENLIGICEKAIVQESKWGDRDSHHSHIGVGTVWALLKAGCAFEIKDNPEGICCTDDKTIWIEIFARDFSAFENGEERGCGEQYYLPTEARLKEAEGGDWY